MMYHHHLLSLDDKETVKQIYEKQKESRTKGDWYDLLCKDFIFVEKEINEKGIKEMTREDYKKMIKALVKKAALKMLLKEKEKHSKLNELVYEDLIIQPYLTERNFNLEERKLLTLLRSRCHAAKANFKKLYKSDLKCSLGCYENEDQTHIFTQCLWLLNINQNSTEYNDLFKDSRKQKEAMVVFIQKENQRKLIIEANKV